MKRIRHIVTFLASLLVFVTISGLTAPEPSGARLWYLKEFATHYPDLKDKARKAKCDVCHVPKQKDRKKRNIYGEALAKSLGATKVKDKDKIHKALEKTEKEKSAVEGKTFGDLIKEGKLPASTE